MLHDPGPPQAASAAEAGACHGTAASCRADQYVTYRKYDVETGTEMICTSEVKVPRCAPECTATSTRFVKVAFDCVAASRSVQRPAQHDEDYRYVNVETGCVPR